MRPSRANVTKAETSRLRAMPSIVLGAVFVAITLCVVAITFLANSVRGEVDALAAANSDTTQWSLAQTEVELLALIVAVQDGLLKTPPDLQEIRRRYDILYSRIRLISRSQQFVNLRSNEDAVALVEALNEFLKDYTPIVDSPDPALSAAMPDLSLALDRLRPEARGFSLLGVKLFAQQSDTQREAVAALLARIGLLTLALVLALIGVIAILMALFRRSLNSERIAADARNRLEEVIATSLDGVLAVDLDGIVVEYNGAAERIFGYSRGEAIGREMGDLIVPKHLRNAHSDGMQRYRETGTRHVVGSGLLRLEAQRKDGTVFPVEISVSSAQAEGGEIFVSFIRDISDRVAAEEELISARDRAVAGERAKAELLAVMSHEMRTPLNGILGTIELLEDTPMDARQSRFVSAMKTSAGLLLHHVNGVLSISSAEAGQLNLAADAVDPVALVQELVESQRHAIEIHGNKISIDTRNAPATVWIDALRLRQVILNLIGNANKFTRNGDIMVECETVAGNIVEFRVVDTGIGIPEAEHERIFEEFRMLDTSYGRLSEGTGLGLSISRRLVLAMGGEIGVESEPGEGSLFWIRLPIGEADPKDRLPDEESPAKNEAPLLQRPLRILLVEDNAINRLVAHEMLQQAGHRVIEANDGRDGFEMAAQQPFDVILMDISMPGIDGVSASRMIRGTDGPNRETPILALTAHALPEDRARFVDAGISDTILKPLTKEALLTSLATVAGAKHQPEPREKGQVADVIEALSDRIGAERAKSLAQTFMQEVDDLLRQMTEPDWPKRTASDKASMVHKVAGSAAVFAAYDLQELLRWLEDGYRSGAATPEDDVLEDIVDTWNETRGSIEASL